ncbi:MAG: STAS domain-containing protein [Chitinophagaceae bacterium]|nr:STAS domain-containing protein [Chitinophagaceae bacterium]
MEYRIKTKEKFHIIYISDAEIGASQTEALQSLLLSYLQQPVKNIVLSLKHTQELNQHTAETLMRVHQQFYEKDASLVICELQKPVEQFLKEKELFDKLNITPTLSEAFDIVQMEELEREMFGEEDEEMQP